MCLFVSLIVLLVVFVLLQIVFVCQNLSYVIKKLKQEQQKHELSINSCLYVQQKNKQPIALHYITKHQIPLVGTP